MTDQYETMKRPLGITIICLLLGWLSIGGLGNSIIIMNGLFLPVVPRWFGLFALAYGITAVVSVYKLWHMSASGPRWLRAWMAVTVLLAVAMMPIFADLALGGVAGMFVFIAFIAVILGLLNAYVSRKFVGGE